MRSLTRWPSASAGSEISADVRAVTDTGESSQPDAPETRRGRRKEGRQTSLSRSGRSREIWTISQTAAANDGVHASRRPAHCRLRRVPLADGLRQREWSWRTALESRLLTEAWLDLAPGVVRTREALG